MKRQISILACLVMIVAVVFTMASCEVVNKIIPGEQHECTEYSEAVTKAPTCTEKGVKTFTCTECSATKTEEIPATGHVLEDVAEKAATCTEGGYKAYKDCKNCDYTEGYEVIPAGHVLEDVAEKAATCIEDGYKAYKDCKNCDYTEGYEVIPAGHVLEDVAEKAATCIDAGYTAHKACKNCNYTEGYEVVGVVGHNIVDGVCSMCEGKIAVKTTDTYCYVDEYTFVASAAGTYTFTVPAGLGFFDKAEYVSYGYPEIDFYDNSNGHEFDLDLDEDEVLVFLVGALSKGDWTITWTYTESTGDDSGDDVPVTVVKDANGLGGEYTFTFLMEYTLTFVPESEGATTGSLIVVDPVYPANSGTYAYMIVDGGYVFATGSNAIITQDMGGNWYFQNSGMMTAQQFAEGTASGGSDDSESSNIVIGSNSIIFTEDEIAAGSADRIFVSTASGNYTFVCGDLFFSVKDADGNAIAKTDGAYALGEGEYTISFGMFSMLSTQANTSYTLTVSVVEEQEEEEADGSESYPYVWETIPESVVVDYSVIRGKVYYTFTASVSGSITFTWPVEGDSWYDYFEIDEEGNLLQNNGSGFMADSHSFVIEAGKSYRVSLGSWAESGSHTIAISVVVCDHVWSDATCETYSTCANCGATTGDLAAHTPGAEATCSAPQTCTVCGAELATANHSWDEGVVTKEADCSTESNGTKLLTCTVCNATKEATILYSHDIVVDENVSATCTTAGSYKEHCAVCDYTYSRTDDAQGHYNWYATCGETTTCMECGETFTMEHSGRPATCVSPMYCYNCWSDVGEPLGHTMTYTEAKDPTCTEAGNNAYYYCSACEYYFTDENGENETTVEDETIAATGVHTDANGDYKCDYSCGTILAPEADSVLTIEQAIALGKAYASGSKSENKYYVVGTVKNVYNTTYGNMYITDGTNELQIYGTYSADGSTSYDALDVKPIKGDTVKLYGVIGCYNSAAQMQSGWITEHTAHEHNYSEATCKVLATCSICNSTTGELSTEHNYVNGVCTVCEGVDPDYKGEVEAGSLLAFEINGTQFDSTSYANNNTTKTVNGYKYTSYQVYLKSGGTAMQWQKGKSYITVDETNASGIVKIVISAQAGTYTVTVGDNTVEGTTVDGIITYDLTGYTGAIKIAESDATGYTDYVKFYK